MLRVAFSVGVSHMIRKPVSLLLAVFCAILLPGLSNGQPVQAAPVQSAQSAVPERSFELTIKQRAVTGKKVVRVKQGEAVRLNWTTDEAVSLHLHGYDIEVSATPARTAAMAFKATASGRFPVTVHGWGSKRQGHGHGPAALLYVEVHPR